MAAAVAVCVIDHENWMRHNSRTVWELSQLRPFSVLMEALDYLMKMKYKLTVCNVLGSYTATSFGN